MQSSGSAGSSKLTMLNGRENYRFWRTQIQFYLDEHNCWDIVNSIELRPDGSVPQTPVSGDDETVVSNDRQHQTALRDWKSRNARAVRVIMTSTVPEIGENLVDFADAQSMWTYLKRYEGSGPAQRIEAYNAWKDLQLAGRNLQVLSEKYQKTLRQINNFNMAPGHELRVYDLINRVAPFHSTWADIKRESLRKVTLSATAPADEHLPSIDSLIKDLSDQDAEMRRQDKNVNVTFKSPPSKSHGRKCTERTALGCTHCHMTGHTENKCYRNMASPRAKVPRSMSRAGMIAALLAPSLPIAA